MKPTIGRIVGYTDRDDPACTVHAAMIIDVLDEDKHGTGAVKLRVFYRDGTVGIRNKALHHKGKAGCEDARGRWAWPKLEKPAAAPKPDKPDK